jgi:hypothetical protein
MQGNEMKSVDDYQKDENNSRPPEQSFTGDERTDLELLVKSKDITVSERMRVLARLSELRQQDDQGGVALSVMTSDEIEAELLTLRAKIEAM